MHAQPHPHSVGSRDKRRASDFLENLLLLRSPENGFYTDPVHVANNSHSSKGVVFVRCRPTSTRETALGNRTGASGGRPRFPSTPRGPFIASPRPYPFYTRTNIDIPFYVVLSCHDSPINYNRILSCPLNFAPKWLKRISRSAGPVLKRIN